MSVTSWACCCRSGARPFSLCLLEGGFGHCYFCVGKSSPADAQKCCWWGVIHSSPLQSCRKVFAGLLQCQDPQEAVLQVQLTPASLWIPVQGRLKWVLAGMEAGSGGFEPVFAGCLRFCGNAFLNCSAAMLTVEIWMDLQNFCSVFLDGWPCADEVIFIIWD